MSEVPAVQIITEEQALLMKHNVLQAIIDAHDSPIRPEAFFKIARDGAKILSCLECIVAMSSLMAMIEKGISPQKMYEGLTAASSVSTLDAHKLYRDLISQMRLVQEIKNRNAEPTGANAVN